MKKSAIFITLLGICLSITCGSGETYTSKIEDGVNIIHNKAPLWGDDPKIELKLVQKIGDLEHENENYLLFNPFDIAKDADGNLYVLDMGNYRVQVYDAGGKYITTMGRQGNGPGELVVPMSINIDNEGNIVVADWGNNRIQKFSPDGKDLGSNKTSMPFQLLRFLSTGEMVTQSVSMNPNVEVNSLISISDSGGNVVKEFGEIDKSKSGDLTLREISNAIMYDVDSEDNIITVYLYRNRIDKYTRDGTLLFRTDRKLNFPVPDRPDMKKVTTPDGQTVEVPQPVMVSFGVQTDGNSRIWAATFREQPDYENIDPNNPIMQPLFDFHIFDKEGVLLAVLQIDEKFTNFRIFGDRLYAVDTAGTMSVYEYKIVEK